MVIAIFLPRKEPSANCSLAIAFRTGACWATQSILRCPSGASAGSLMTEPPGVLDACCMLALLRSDPRGRSGCRSVRRCLASSGSPAKLANPSAPFKRRSRVPAPLRLPCRPTSQNLHQRLGFVGNHGVGARVEHLAHPVWVVDGPHVHPHPD